MQLAITQPIRIEDAVAIENETGFIEEITSTFVVVRVSNTVELRALISARNVAATFDLRCEVREKLIACIAREFPQALPRRRQEAVIATGAAADAENRRPRAVP